MAEVFTEREFAGYRIDARLGRGGMGVVYRATDLSLDRTVALKMLLEELAEDPVFRERFVTESRLAASLDHPNVIPIYAAGEYEGILYLAMRYVEGEDLGSHLRSRGRLEPERVRRLVEQVGLALDAAHARGLVHRDVKPANVLLTRDGHAYLSDFGLSKRVATTSRHTRAGEVMGTLDYIAPEQIRSEPLGPATDVYALGCVTYHLLTGRVPFPLESDEAKLWAHISEPPPRPSDLVDDLPSGFDRVVARAMSKDPEDRYPSAANMAANVAAIERDASTRTRAPAPAAPRPVPSRRPASRPVRSRDPVTLPPGERREALIGALRDPFNLVVLGVLLAIGVALETVALMTLLAVLVYAAGVARSYVERRARDV